MTLCHNFTFSAHNYDIVGHNNDLPETCFVFLFLMAEMRFHRTFVQCKLVMLVHGRTHARVGCQTWFDLIWFGLMSYIKL